MKSSTGKQNLSQTGGLKGFSIYNTEGNTYYKGEVERVAKELREELYPTPKAPSLPKTEIVAGKRDNLSRKTILTIVLILNVLILFVNVASCFDIGLLTNIFAPFYKELPGGTIVAVSAMDGFLGEIGCSRIDYSLHGDTISDVVLIVFAIAGVGISLLAFLQAIKALVMLTKKGDGKKCRFGKVSFIMLILLVVVFLSVIFLKAEFGFGDLCSLLFPKTLGEYGLPRPDEGYTLYTGSGMLFLLGGPILCMLLSLGLREKKNKEVENAA